MENSSHGMTRLLQHCRILLLKPAIQDWRTTMLMPNHKGVGIFLFKCRPQGHPAEGGNGAVLQL